MKNKAEIIRDDVLVGRAVKCPLCHNFMIDDFGVSINYCKNCCNKKSIKDGKIKEVVE